MNGPRTLPILYLSDRIMTYGTAVCPQSLQVQDQADSYAGAGASVCLATLPGTLQRGVAGAAGRLAKGWRGGYCWQTERPNVPGQNGSARIPPEPITGLSGRAEPPCPRRPPPLS